MKTTKLKQLFALTALSVGVASTACAVDMLAPMEGPEDGMNLSFTQDVSHIFKSKVKASDSTLPGATEDDKIGITRARSVLTHRSEQFMGTLDVEAYYEYSNYKYSDTGVGIAQVAKDNVFTNANTLGLDGVYHHAFDDMWGAYVRGIAEWSALSGGLSRGGHFLAELGVSATPNADFTVYAGGFWTKLLSAKSRFRPVAGFFWKATDGVELGLRHSISDITGYANWDVWMDGLLVVDASVGYNLRQHRVDNDLVNTDPVAKHASLYYQSILWTVGATHNFTDAFFVRGFVVLSTGNKARLISQDKEVRKVNHKSAFGLGIQGGIRL